jgi:predicted transcriptional regulator
VPRGRGKVTIEVSRELRDRIRELSQKYGLLYEELLWKALDTLTQSITQSNTLSITQSKGGAFTQSSTQSKAKAEEKRHIIVFTLEWARQKGINVEEYMAKKEKEGYICNETSRKVYCIWREDIEQLVVELNSSNARMGELENVLSGEKLNIAKQAIEAGLLWYDSREKWWKAPL